MILIPELETVVILVPRTGSSTLRRVIAAKYPRSYMLYRHMEADGVPQGYDRWLKVGVVRHPVDRLWSLYKFLRNGLNGEQALRDPAWLDTMRRSSQRSFDSWLLNNREVFTSPYDYSGGSKYWPNQTVLHPRPENLKSQYVYLRPDLGTKIIPYPRLHLLGALLGVDLIERHNQTEQRNELPLHLSHDAQSHVERVFAWDLEMMS